MAQGASEWTQGDGLLQRWCGTLPLGRHRLSLLRSRLRVRPVGRICGQKEAVYIDPSRSDNEHRSDQEAAWRGMTSYPSAMKGGPKIAGFEPGYIRLHKSGELARRVVAARQILAD